MNADFGSRRARRIGRLGRFAAALAIVGACGLAPAARRVQAVFGRQPAYGPGMVSDVPNWPALDRLIWMPGLDRFWAPQGLAVAGDAILVSAYRSDRTWQNRGPCRVFRVDPESGTQTGHFDVPPPCGHAGGLAYAADGELFISDTHTLFATKLDRAFAGTAPNFRIFPLGRGLRGAFAVSGRAAIWIGAYEEDRPAKVWRYDVGALARLETGAALDAGAASAVVRVPSYAQGGAFDPAGKLWVSRSDIGWGFLDRRDAVTGRLEQRYAVAAGIEGIAFDRAGRLWAVSEAGARHFPWRYPFFPLLFRIAPQRLAPAPPEGSVTP